MAHSNSLITGRLRGSLGKELVFRQWDGKTIVAKAPKARTASPTPRQAEMQERFLLASCYAKSIITDPDTAMAEAYRNALKPRQNVYCRAAEDFLSLPTVTRIDTRNYKGAAGDKIAIRAQDDFRVIAVRVEVLAADGTLLEAGKAEQSVTGIDWMYTVTQAIAAPTGAKIRAIARDVPGNEGSLEATV
jgi:hypothetical protein